MRIQYLGELIIISLFLVALIVAAVFKRKKYFERTATSLFNVLISIIVPLAGNTLVVTSSYDYLASSGYMLMLLGDCFVCYNLLVFLMDYCGFRFRHSPVQFIAITVLGSVTLSIILNPFFGHIFGMEQVYFSDGSYYYALIPHWGMLLGFSLIQSLFVLMIAILIDKCLKISSAYHERYVVIMIAMLTCMAFLFFVLFLAFISQIAEMLAAENGLPV